MYPHERFIRAGFTGQRACGRRAAGGVYAETRLSDAGLPLEHFLLCPPRPVDPAALGLASVGVQLIEHAGAWHICDVVGREHYPHVADFVEETRRKGASRRLPRTLDFARLSAASRLVLIHARARIVNFDRYPQPPVAACPQDVHLDELAEPCAGLWWHDLPEADLERWEEGGLTYRSLPGGVTYSAYPRPAGVAPVYQHGIFMSLPITNLAVIAGRNPQEEQEAEAAHQSAHRSGLPVFREEE